MMNKQVLILILLVLSLMMWTSCMRDDVQNIGDGYQLISIYSGADTLVAEDGEVIVSEHVSSYSINQRYIVGIREKTFTMNGRQNYGYFIFDKYTKGLKTGVPKEEFSEFVKANNIDFDVD